MKLGDWINMVATLGLLLTALLTWRAAEASKASAQASESLLSVEVAPIIEVVRTPVTSGGGTAPFIEVDLKNLGRGPALNGSVETEVGSVPKLEPLAAFDVLASGDTTTAKGIVNSDYVLATQGAGPVEVKATVTYSDIVGNRYRTVRWVKFTDNHPIDGGMTVEKQLADGSFVPIVGPRKA